MTTEGRDDCFELWDLRVEVVAGDRPMVCNHREGDSFELVGENLSLPPGQTFPLYPLAALLPLLPAKQRLTHPHDWMTTDTEVACPDPHCGARFRIVRTGKSVFRHSEVTRVPLETEDARAGSGPPPKATSDEPSRGGVGREEELPLTFPPPRIELAAGYSVPRCIVGCWQLSEGHGAVSDRSASLERLLELAEAGFDTFDAADIYTGVEELLGDLVRLASRSSARPALQIHTKMVPDLDRLATLRRRDVEAVVDRSLLRLGVERLDLLQFHWWDFEVPGWIEAAGWLDELRREGKIRLLGVTNFDTAHLADLADAGIAIVSNQVQYSLLDRRPEAGLLDFCAGRGIHLLAYGSLAGGFLSDTWLGRDDPGPVPGNRSLVKYRLIVEELGGWEALQELLRGLGDAAAKSGVTVAQIAAAWVLGRPSVASVLSGFSPRTTPGRLAGIADLSLEADLSAELDSLLGKLGSLRGEVFELERQPGGVHASIMKTNLQGS